MAPQLHPRRAGALAPAADLLLVRHGQSVLGAQGRYAGHTDAPMTGSGIAEVGRLAAELRPLPVTRVFSSDLARCRATAARIWPRAQVVCSPQLRELSFGAWEGRHASECAHESPAHYARWLEDPWRVAPPGGETLASLTQRARAFADWVASTHPGGRVALVTHAGWIRALLAPTPEAFWTLDVPPGSCLERTWPCGVSACGA